MTSTHRRVREIAADIVAECGPYAQMAALFLASEWDEEGDAEGVVLWTRVARAVGEIAEPPAPGGRAKLH